MDLLATTWDASLCCTDAAFLIIPPPMMPCWENPRSVVFEVFPPPTAMIFVANCKKLERSTSEFQVIVTRTCDHQEFPRAILSTVTYTSTWNSINLSMYKDAFAIEDWDTLQHLFHHDGDDDFTPDNIRKKTADQINILQQNELNRFLQTLYV